MESTVGTHGTLMSRFHAQLAEGETSDRTFGLAVGAIFIALSCVPLLRHRPPALWMIVVGAPLLILGAIAPAALRRVKRAWLFLGFLLGLVVNPIVLGILFFGVIAPCGFALRLFGGDPLRLRSSTQPSYWRDRPAPISTMEDQF